MSEFTEGTRVRVTDETVKHPTDGTVLGKRGGLVRVALDGGFWVVAVPASSVTAAR